MFHHLMTLAVIFISEWLNEFRYWNFPLSPLTYQITNTHVKGLINQDLIVDLHPPTAISDQQHAILS